MQMSSMYRIIYNETESVAVNDPHLTFALKNSFDEAITIAVTMN